MPFTYECAGCGQRVVTKMRKHSNVFCTRECYQRASIKYPDRECAGCGQMFNPRRGSRSGPRVAIEADGEYWHAVTAERDAKRDAELERVGWRVVRLPEREVNDARDLGAYILDRLCEVTGLRLADIAPPGQLALWGEMAS